MSGGINSICDHQDLFAEILLRLPVRALIKFKCVSKQWLSLISDPDFCYSHTRGIQQLQTQKPNSSLLIHSAPTRLSLLHLKDESASMSLPRLAYLKVQSLTMLDYCNGLTLFGGFPLDCASDDYENGYSIFVCNPVTRQFRSLFTSTTYSVFVLAFDPCKSPHYKVIVLVIALEELMIKHLRIYCSASNSWRSVECSDVESPPYLNPAVYFNGTVYWASNGERSVCFNVDTERFKILPSPLDTSRTCVMTYSYLRASCGHLFMVCLAWYLKCKVFEMASDCSGWFVRYHVDLAPPFSQVWGTCIMIDIIVGEKEEDTMIVTIAPPSVISYNIHDGTTKVFCDRLSEFYWEGSGRASKQYFETLFNV